MQIKNKKKAFVDQILLWMTLIVGFVTLFFMVIDYAAIARVKSNTDLLAQYGARMIALGRDDADIASSMNNMKVNYFADIAGSDILCTETVATAGVNEYQVVLTVSATYTDTRVITYNDTIQSKIAAFNETNSNFINCTLALTAQ